MDSAQKPGIPSSPAGNSAARGNSLSAETMPLLSLSNDKRDDLLQDALLTTAPRITFDGAQVPALGGIPLLSKLGQGGMGAVYFGVHPRLRMEVAVKVLPFQLASQNPALVQRFFREGQIAARVKSPHLVSVIDVNEETGLFYLVMEYVDGVSAGGLVRQWRKDNPQNPGLTELTALDLCIAATEGLLCAHANAVIHRDIKPDNILIPKNKASGAPLVTQAKVADLGLARIDDGDSSLTGAQSTMGTPGYMAPEQANDAKSAGKPADVFSMGATLYALLSGAPPFQETTSLATILAAIQKPHIPLTKYRTDITLATQEIIDRCLAKDPAVRYADAAEMNAALKNAREMLAGPLLPSKVMRGPTHMSPAMQATLIAPGHDESKPPSSSLIENLDVAPVASAAARKRNGVLGLVAMLAGIPLLIAAGWFGFNTLHTPAAETAPANSPGNADSGNKNTADDNKTPNPKPDDTQKIADEQKAKDAELEKQRQAAMDVMKKSAEQDATRKMLREKADADAQAATATARKLAEAQERLRTTQDAEKAAKAERERANTRVTNAKEAFELAKTEADKRNEELQAKETEIRGTRHTLAVGLALRKLNEAAKEAHATMMQKETEREKARTDLQAAYQAYTSRHDGAVKAEALVAAARDEDQAAQKAASASAEKLKALESGDKPADATGQTGPYKLFDGPYKVETVAGNVRDARRNKDLPLKVYYPAGDAGGPFPVIVFSHGWLASRENYEVLGRFWASHGYIVMHPTHEDALALNGKKELFEGGDPYADQKALEDRFKDVVLVLDSFGWLESKVPALKNRINSKQIGLGGHSLGAYTSQVLGGASVRFKDEGRESFEDKRVDAVLLLSPQGRGEGGLTESSWRHFKKPMLLVSGTQDKGFKKQDATWRKDPYDFSPAGDKYELILEGAKHGLGGISAGGAMPQTPKWLEAILGPDVPEQRDWVRMASLAFWDAYLKNDPTAKAWLNSNALKDLGNGKLTFDHR